MVTRVKLLDWIDLEKLTPTARALAQPNNAARRVHLEALGYTVDGAVLSGSPHAEVLELLAYPGRKFGWLHEATLAANAAPAAYPLTRQIWPTNYDVLAGISGNSSASGIFEEFLPEMKKYGMSGFRLSANPAPHAFKLMRSLPDRIFFTTLLANPNLPEVQRLMEDLVRAEHIPPQVRAIRDIAIPPGSLYAALTASPGTPRAISIILENTIVLDLISLSANTNPEVLALLGAFPDVINWESLSGNPAPAALEMLRACPERIDWPALSRNPGIFEAVYDYPAMRARMDLLREDLARAAGHPRRLARLLEAGGDIEDF